MPDNLIFWMLTVAYTAHIMEEYFLDWKAWAEKTSGLSMQWGEFLLANAAVIVLGIACSVVEYTYPFFSFLFVGLVFCNALFAHIGTTIVKRSFSPGAITSIFLFLPLSLCAYYQAYQKGVLTNSLLIFSLIGGMLIMTYPVVLQGLKKKMKK